MKEIVGVLAVFRPLSLFLFLVLVSGIREYRVDLGQGTFADVRVAINKKVNIAEGAEEACKYTDDGEPRGAFLNLTSTTTIA